MYVYVSFYKLLPSCNPQLVMIGAISAGVNEDVPD